MASGPRSTIPIFPLSSVVLFPCVRVPLHLFEPRYREMARDALAGGRRIGMVAVPPEHLGEMAGDPPTYAVGCEGVIEQSEMLPDGRYNIVLMGTRRFRITEELPRETERLYRIASIEALDDSIGDGDLAHVASLRGEIVDHLIQLLGRSSPKQAAPLSRSDFDAIEDETFVNALSQAVDFPTPEKQALLEAPSVSSRCDQLVAMLSFRLAEQSFGEPSKSDLRH